MTNDRWNGLRDWLWIAAFLLVGGAFLYVAEWPRVRPWAGGVWMVIAVLSWYNIKRHVTTKAGWVPILGSAGMGLAFALYALYYWLNDKRLQDAGVFIIMAYALASMWRQHRARRNENRGTLMT